MNIRDIIKEYLKAQGFDGLYNEFECGCEIKDLMPCSEPDVNCSPGYKKSCCGEDCIYGDQDTAWHIVAEKPEPEKPVTWTCCDGVLGEEDRCSICSEGYED